jgi:WD40 repeat protein/Flp pilus assembly protein TadD/tRNA A-37 threonylcarbamoyl transferase component Bud32
MSPSAPESRFPESRLGEVLAELLQEEEAGRTPDLSAYLARYPDLAEPLRAYFAHRAWFAAEAPHLAPVKGGADSDPGGLVETVPQAPAGDRAPPLAPGTRLGGYEVLEELGRGGMGIVYKARQLEPERLVALKVIRIDRLEELPDEERRAWLERFRREAQVVAALDQPAHIVTLYEVGEDQGRPFFTMRLVEGGSLAQWLRQVEELPGAAEVRRRAQRHFAWLLAKVARAVDYAHQRGILHRDLKPANILLDLGGEPLVSDFGLARRLDQTGSLVAGAVEGSPPYMAPEQATSAGGAAVIASDVYSLGAILYELLTGKPPFLGKDIFDTLLQVLGREPIPPRRLDPRLNRDLETICLKCLQKEPGRRYRSAAELAEDLENWLAGRPIHARPVSSPERVWRWCRRNPVPAAAAAVVLLSVAASFVLISQSRAEAVERADSESKEKVKNAGLAEEYRILSVEKDKLAQSEAAQKLAVEREKLAVERELAHLALHEGRRLAVDYHDPRQGLPLLGYALERAHRAASPDLERVIRTGIEVHGRQLTPLRAILSHADGAIVQDLAFSPDSKLLATVSNDGALQLWDVRTGRPAGPPLSRPFKLGIEGKRLAIKRLSEEETGFTLPEEFDGLYRVAFSPDGKRLATGSMRGWVRLWDVPTGRLLRSMQHHDWTAEPIYRMSGGMVLAAGGVWVLAFSPDGSLLLSGGHDGTAQLWEVASGRRRALMRHPADVKAGAFSPDGSLVATGWAHPDASGVGGARLWDVPTGAPHGAPLAQEGTWAVAFSSDGQRLLTGGGSEASPSQGRQRGFSPDGRQMFYGGRSETLPSRGRAQLWLTRTGQPDGPGLTLEGAVRAVAFSPDGKHYLAVSSSGAIRVVNRTTKEVYTTQHPPLVRRAGVSEQRHLRVTGLTMSPDGRTFVTAGTDAQAFALHNGSTVGAPCVHEGLILAVAVSPDGQTVATAGHDATTRLWEAPTRQTSLVRTLDWRVAVAGLAYGPKADSLLTATADGYVSLLDPDGLRLRVQWLDPHGILKFALFHPAGAKVLTASYDLRKIGNDNTAVLWDVATRKPVGRPWQLPGWVTDASFSRDGELAAIACDRFGRHEPAAFLWDVATGERRLEITHGTKVWKVLFSPDGQMLVTAGDDRTVRRWSTSSGKQIGRPLYHKGEVRALALSPDGKTLLAGCTDGTCQLWDVATGRARGGALRHRAEVVSVAFSPDGRLALTASLDATARLWQVETGTPAAPALVHPSEVLGAVFSPDGTRVLTGCADGSGHLWDGRTGNPLNPLGTSTRHQGAVTCLAFRGDGQVFLTGGQDGLVVQRPVPGPVPGSLAEVQAAVNCLTGRRRDPDSAVRAMTSADWRASLERDQASRLAVFPLESDPQWHRREAETAEALSLWYAAAWHLEWLLRANPGDVQLLGRHGAALARLGRWPEAVRQLSRAIDGGGKDWKLWQERGEARAHLGQDSDAEADLLEAVRRGEREWQPWVALGEFYALRRAWPKAAAAFGQGADRLDAPSAVETAAALSSLKAQDPAGYRRMTARLLERLRKTRRRPERVIQAIRTVWVCSLTPDLVDDQQAVLKLADKAAREPNAMKSYAFVRALGASQLRARQYPAAVEVLQHAATLQRDAPAAWLLLAQAFHHLDEAGQARHWYDRAESWLQTHKQMPLYLGLPWQEKLALDLLHAETRKLLAVGG